jgi:hypothetical protein
MKHILDVQVIGKDVSHILGERNSGGIGEFFWKKIRKDI